MTFDAHAYTITTRKVSNEGEISFKATVAELPNLSTYEDTAESAYASIIEDIAALHAMALELGHAFPEPLGEPAGQHTGRVTLRLPRMLHSRLAEQSVLEDVSLNTYLVALLSEAASARTVASTIARSIQANVREALMATQLIHEAGAGKPASVYSTTAEIVISEKDETWTKLH